MQTKSLDFDLDIKALSEDGVFEGYGSTFGTLDSYGEKVMSGAFAESLTRHRRKGTSPLMLWQHDPREPIGVWLDLAEDGRGLWGKGQLVLGVPRADATYRLLKAKALRGLSIGYRELESEPEGNVRKIRKVDLQEISVVSFPACPDAWISSVKSEHFDTLRERLSAGEPPTLREWERGLREAFGLSHSQAERAVRLCLKHIAQGELGNANEATAKEAITALRDALQGFPLTH